MGQPGTVFLLKAMLMTCSHASNGTKLTEKRAFPCGVTCVGIFWPRADIVISRLPSPAWLASTAETGRHALIEFRGIERPKRQRTFVPSFLYAATWLL